MDATTTNAISEFARCIGTKGSEGDAVLAEAISILCGRIVRQAAGLRF